MTTGNELDPFSHNNQRANHSSFDSFLENSGITSPTYSRIIRRQISRSDIIYNLFFPVIIKKVWEKGVSHRNFLRNLRTEYGERQVVNFYDFTMNLDLSSLRDASIFALHQNRKIYESTLSEIIQSFLKPGMTFVDAGANNGYFSLMASKLVGPTGFVHSFEPSPRNLPRLIENVGLNSLNNISTHNVALGNADGFIDFYLSSNEDGCDSSVKLDHYEQKVSVKVTPLDNVLKGKIVDFVKIDVEGYELEVLQGCDRLIRDNQNIIISVEQNDQLLRTRRKSRNSVIEWLLDQGFMIRELVDTVDTKDASLSHLVSARDIKSCKDLSKRLANLLCIKPANTNEIALKIFGLPA